MAQAAEQLFGRRAQVDDGRRRAQRLPVGVTQNGATAGGQNHVRTREQFAENGLLDIAKPRFAFALEELADRAADLFFEFGVGVGEAKVQATGEVSADGGFATAGHADKADQGHNTTVPGAGSVEMNWLTVVLRPLGDVKVTWIVPDVVGALNS